MLGFVFDTLPAYTFVLQTDRSITPWLIVLLHSPWYTSYNGHFKENECMRETYEWLLVKYGVDIVMSGHVHAYERTKPVRDYQVGTTCTVAVVGVHNPHYYRTHQCTALGQAGNCMVLLWLLRPGT